MNISADKHYFAFIDESGNSSQEPYFGLGLLLVDEAVGDVYDTMKPYYDRALDMAKLQKANRIQVLSKLGAIEEIAEIANSNRKFELKFKYANHSNNLIYKALVENYFRFPTLRFCALVIERDGVSDSHPGLEPWDAYIHRAAMLLANNVRELCPCSVTVLADDLTKPKNVTKTFERSLHDAIGAKLAKQSVPSPIRGIARLESHASLMIQLVDILLGAVMYDFKWARDYISENQAEKQEPVVETIRRVLKVRSLADVRTCHTPNYFSVWKFKQ